MRHSIRKMQFDLSQLQLNVTIDKTLNYPEVMNRCKHYSILVAPPQTPLSTSDDLLRTPTSCTRVVNVNQSHECIPSHLFLDRVEESHRRG
ncbi:BZ3500_MvSof-1268-A1-R1_Chr1-1g00816 [Microbotryum saponariae]|uniref:BZ3500_MvSof-1268-A1-R1_Chr1-1g00816 protein n=1 Tax=Microbotryum saponariae TaxID=289078 RepID=A0A2X0KBU2_9BASI|nr:BZ3500_MvSof-1268-A1-R1_Chr1-1g00816 [Microbotryum saponariae]